VRKKQNSSLQIVRFDQADTHQVLRKYPKWLQSQSLLLCHVQRFSSETTGFTRLLVSEKKSLCNFLEVISMDFALFRLILQARSLR
jgi:hypothetical protein